MPSQPTAMQARLKNVTTCLTGAAATLDVLADNLKNPALDAIFITTQSLLKFVETIKQNKSDGAQLMEETHELLNAIILVYIKSETGAELAPSVLTHIAKFTKTLHQIHTFLEANQKTSAVKKLFRQGEMSRLLKECKIGLQEGLDFFQIETVKVMVDVTQLREDARRRHQEVLRMIDTFYDGKSSDGGSYTSRVYSSLYNSSNSISMLPSEPKIFHGRESQLVHILELFRQRIPRISILGAGGMGKTSLARALLHHTDITSKYGQYRFFVACDSASTTVELANLIGAHLGVKPGKNLTRAVVQHFSSGPASILILDNLETLWEPIESRKEIEEFLSLLADVASLALMVTMRGAERPAKVNWSRPFLQPLISLDPDAARRTFADIADSIHDPVEVDKVLALTDNLPLAINLLAHLVDSEGCSTVLTRWDEEKTSMISDGYDRRSNLDLSISLSLSSPRINSHSRELLSLLSILPDGFSDVELLHSGLPLDDILSCKIALMATTLAYNDGHKRLKSLVPIREYMQKNYPPAERFLRPLLKYFHDLLDVYIKEAINFPGIHAQIHSNYSNIQNALRIGLTEDHPDLEQSMYCAVYLSNFSRRAGRGTSRIPQVLHMLPQPCDYRLEVTVVLEVLNSARYHHTPNSETLILQVLEHIDNIDDTDDLKCAFHDSAAYYYASHAADIPKALSHSETVLSLAISTGNTKRQCDGLYRLAWMSGGRGDYATGHRYAHEGRRLAQISGQPYREAQGLRIEAACCSELGNYKESMFLCERARSILRLCGLSGGELDRLLLRAQGEVLKLKSEYAEARKIETQILRETSPELDRFNHAHALLAIAEIGVSFAPREEVQKNLDAAKSIFDMMGDKKLGQACDIVRADLLLREGEFVAAEALIQKVLQTCWGKWTDVVSYGLELLGDGSRWEACTGTSPWTTVFLARSLKSKQKLGTSKALLCLGDVFLGHHDEYTAISLFTVALEGFICMDVHRSRAECMLRLGDIAKRKRDLLNAVELWETARPLFERSAQAKRVEDIDKRLASIDDDVKEQFRLARAADPEPQEEEGGLSDVEDSELHD